MVQYKFVTDFSVLKKTPKEGLKIKLFETSNKTS